MVVLKKYLSLIKFSHTIFAMPFALIGFFLGFSAKPQYVMLNGYPEQVGEVSEVGQPAWVKFSLVLMCMVFARAAAMAFNRYLDRHYDAKNPRTAIREIPAGAIKASNALQFTIMSCLLFIACTWFINELCFYLSPVALFIVLFYSYTKRFTALCHLVLGVGLSLAPIGAYLAVTGEFAVLPILFSFTVLFWVSGFDIIYALQDEEFDKSENLHSIPVAAGKKNALLISRTLHAFSAICVVAAGIYGKFGILYWVGVCVFAGMLIFQQSIVKPNDLRRVNLAFMTANGIASVVFSIFVLLDIFIN